VRAKTPLAEVFFLPGNGARKLDGAELMKYKWSASWKTPREGFDEYSSKFSLSYKTKVINPVGERQMTKGDAK
jgi:hypothetical protein